MEEIVNQITNAIEEFKKHKEIKYNGDTIKSFDNFDALIRMKLLNNRNNIDENILHKLVDKLNALEYDIK